MTNHFRSKKLLPVLLLALVSLSVLSGCHGAQYTEEEREELIPRD